MTVMKLASVEDWPITGIYRSPNLPVRQICEAITEVLNNISPDNIIIGHFNINWLVETDRRPLHNPLLRDKHYKQLISTTVNGPIYTRDGSSVWDKFGQRTVVRLIIRLCINTGFQTDHPSRRTTVDNSSGRSSCSEIQT